MKKRSCRLLICVIITAILLSCVAFSVLAANCSVWFSDPSVTVGNTVTVDVSVSGDVAAATIRLSYDTGKLEFVSVSGGNSSGGGGAIVLDNEYSSGTGSMSFSISFKALQTGEARISCTSYDIVDGGGDAMDVSMGSSTVTINAAPTASSDATLSRLSINPGSLSPSFSSSTTSYTASVSNSVTSIAVSATKNDSKASVSVSGNDYLSVGSNKIYIIVTAENGSTKTYTITVTRAAGKNDENPDEKDPEASQEPTEPTEEKEPSGILEDGTVLKIVEFEDAAIPQGFKKTEISVSGTKVSAIVLSSGDVYAVYLEGDESHPAGFYLFNSKTRAASPFVTIAMAPAESTLLLLDASAVKEAPKGYILSKVQLRGSELTVFVPQNVKQANHYLVYAATNNGEATLYLYDISEKTFQKYNFAVLSDGVMEPEPSAEPSVEPSPEVTPAIETKEDTIVLFGFDTGLSVRTDTLVYIILGSVVVLLALLIVILVMAVKLDKCRCGDEEPFEEEFDRSVIPEKQWQSMEEAPSEQIVQQPVPQPQPSQEKAENKTGRDAFSLEDILKEYSNDQKK